MGLDSEKTGALEGYGVDIVLIITRRGAPNSADLHHPYGNSVDAVLRFIVLGPPGEIRTARGWVGTRMSAFGPPSYS